MSKYSQTACTETDQSHPKLRIDTFLWEDSEWGFKSRDDRCHDQYHSLKCLVYCLTCHILIVSPETNTAQAS